MGRWQGFTLGEAMAREPEAVDAWLVDPRSAPHGGESLLEFIQRVGGWLDTRPADDGGKIVAVAGPAVDIGAMPLPVVPALVTGCGQNKATDDDALLKRHIQDTLDLIEFANGPVTSEWGKKRAQMGHPKPFNLTHLGVGNEENLPNEFFARFKQFRAAIEAKYPDITVISNSGPDDAGETFDTAWKLNREANVDMVDEHYYNSPEWFLQNNDRYDATCPANSGAAPRACCSSSTALSSRTAAVGATG